MLKPFIAQHETVIDRKIMELKARAWDFFIFYFHNFAQVHFDFSSPKSHGERSELENAVTGETESEPHTPLAPRPLNKSLSALRSLEKQTSRGRQWPPPTPPKTPGRESAGTFNSEDGINIPDTIPGSPITEAQSRLRRSNSRPHQATS
ncbi:unnamed protein product [Cochlearia groenlandica]